MPVLPAVYPALHVASHTRPGRLVGPHENVPLDTGCEGLPVQAAAQQTSKLQFWFKAWDHPQLCCMRAQG